MPEDGNLPHDALDDIPADRRFQYARLDQSKQEIRLIRLLPAERWPAQVTCHGLQVSLQDAPNYMALSYCWGDRSNPICIKCNNKCFPVTQNLYEFLKRVRQRIRKENLYGVYLWVDAICINQRDNLEKDYQLPLMGEIYKRAFGTLVWLGDSGDYSTIAMGLLRVWGDRFAYGQYASEVFKEFLNQTPLSSKPQAWEAVRKLLRRPWWTRIWVLQEYALSRNVDFLCGSSHIARELMWRAFASWHALASSPDVVKLDSGLGTNISTVPSTGYYLLFEFVRLRSGRESALFAVDAPRVDLEWLAEETAVLKSSDPRDHIYALLGLNQAEAARIVPRYDDPVSKVFIDFTVETIRASASLNVLRMAGVGPTRDGFERDSALPSWVRDFRQSTFIDAIKSAVKYHGAYSINREELLLSVLGINCGVVKSVFDEPKTELRLVRLSGFILNSGTDNWTGISMMHALFRIVWYKLTPRALLSDGSDQEEKFLDMANAFLCYVAVAMVHIYEDGIIVQPTSSRQENCLEPLDISQYYTQELQKLYQQDPHGAVQGTVDNLRKAILRLPIGVTQCQWLWPNDRQIDPAPLGFLTHHLIVAINQRTADRSYFVTHNGYIGLGPKSIEAGDKLCMISECSMPVLLRKKGDREILVGPTYVYGLMNGEAMSKLADGEFKEEKFVIE